MAASLPTARELSAVERVYEGWENSPCGRAAPVRFAARVQKTAVGEGIVPSPTSCLPGPAARRRRANAAPGAGQPLRRSSCQHHSR